MLPIRPLTIYSSIYGAFLETAVLVIAQSLIGDIIIGTVCVVKSLDS